MNPKPTPHLVLLEPSDVLFFRDGRPMTGGLAGHGAAWPLPNVINAAFHGALHRTDWSDLHAHNHYGRNGVVAKADARKFGSLLTAGPFPVRLVGASNPPGALLQQWFFPRPADVFLGDNGTCLEIALKPAKPVEQWVPAHHSSLPAPLSLAVASCLPPSKEPRGFQWLEQSAYGDYLAGRLQNPLRQDAHLDDGKVFEAEFTVGIGIDPTTQAQDGKRIYSAHYLRLRPEWRLGGVAACRDSGPNASSQPRDLLAALLPDDRGNVLNPAGQPTRASDPLATIIVGGQQRLCRATREPAADLPLPRGCADGFQTRGAGQDKRSFVKWVLLTPAIWPEMQAGDSRRGRREEGEGIAAKLRSVVAHHGGWFPNWVDPVTGRVLLRVVTDSERRRRRQLNYAGKGYASEPGTEEIHATLVAALVPKAIPVTGWGFQVPGVDDSDSGAKTTHLAVPAGAVYYFETHGPDAEAEAVKLAAALNWHGTVTNTSTDFTCLKNRRSTLFGEKGFGLGVCGTWAPIEV